MSYTLRGRLESRLAAAIPPLVVALAVHRWWAIELVALMLVVALLLDAFVYDRLLAYQPGWAALPLGAVELVLTVGAMRALALNAPLGWALALFGFAWLSAQVLAHAVLPRLQLSYAEDGGELRRAGPIAALAVVAALAVSGGVAYATQPPTVHLRAGTHQGPITIRRAETLVGERGAVVVGGIRVRANGVTIRNVTVLGGENGIDVENAHHVTLDNVHVVGPSLDGIHVRRSTVMIRNCVIDSPRGPWTQGIDISFAADMEMSMIEGCHISGTREGIVTHFAQVEIAHNHVSGTTLRGITAGEMSMDMVHSNDVDGALGVGIFCVDHSECEIEHNVVTNTRVDRSSDDPTRAGVAIEAHYASHAHLRDNTIVASPGGVGAFADSTIHHR